MKTSRLFSLFFLLSTLFIFSMCDGDSGGGNSKSSSKSDPQNTAPQIINLPYTETSYIGSPDDAVGAVCYLLSDEARYVNGTNIHLSGGWGI